MQSKINRMPSTRKLNPIPGETDAWPCLERPHAPGIDAKLLAGMARCGRQDILRQLNGQLRSLCRGGLEFSWEASPCLQGKIRFPKPDLNPQTKGCDSGGTMSTPDKKGCPVRQSPKQKKGPQYRQVCLCHKKMDIFNQFSKDEYSRASWCECPEIDGGPRVQVFETSHRSVQQSGKP